MNNNKNSVQIVCHHNRKFQEDDAENNDDDDHDDNDHYSQGESDDGLDILRVLDLFKDKEPSTDGGKEKILNRQNGRRYGWRVYVSDNLRSLLFFSERNQEVVLNENVMTFLTMKLQNNLIVHLSKNYQKLFFAVISTYSVKILNKKAFNRSHLYQPQTLIFLYLAYSKLLSFT